MLRVNGDRSSGPMVGFLEHFCAAPLPLGEMPDRFHLRALDAIRNRVNREAAGNASIVWGANRSVPNAFRELAGKEL
jgi:hypothetical protein